MTRSRTLLLILMLTCLRPAWAQNTLRTEDGSASQRAGSGYSPEGGVMPGGGTNQFSWGRGGDDEEEEEGQQIPIGQFQWRLDRRLGNIIDAENNDTVVHNFQNFNLTEGYTGQYSFLGNVGAPRLNRIFLNRDEGETFLFLQPLSFFRGSLQDFRFTNTLSPITNLAYHKCGNSQNGQDRVRAYFASNINKISGIGFKLDYLYGRGYYNSQQNSQFGGTVYGYYRGERYNAHAYINVSHLKMAENGGIENDRYIEDPQSFPQSYSSKDIPVNITDTYNRNHEQTFFLSHRYNVGFDRELEVPDSLMPQPPTEAELMKPLGDSLRAVLQADTLRRAAVVDSLMQQWQQTVVMPTEFVPVTSFIHTFDVERLAHTFLARQLPASYFTNHYYGNTTDIEDITRGMSIKNTIGMQLREGFNKWAQMEITLFGTHQLATYTLPLPADTTVMTEHFTEHDLSVGSVLSRQQGRFIHYNVEGELWLLGENLGDFTVDGDVDLDLPMGRLDSLQLNLQAFIHSQKPSFYWRHYRNCVTWWDQEDLSRDLRTRLMGTVTYPRTKTRLTVGVENLKNYTYFGMKNELRGRADSTSTVPTDYTHDVEVRQHTGNVQVFSATLGQDFKLGPLGWENELTYQKSSNQTVLPLPKLSLYTNLYLLFHISKILRVQVGGDMRFFTSYYAPDYAPGVSQFAVQDASFARVKVGNYPIINAYVNLHLKHCRLYLAMNHVNQGSGRYYWAPHYPVDPRTFHFGVSWNFFN